MKKAFHATLGLLLLLTFCIPAQGETIKLLNVSYDPTRELFQEFNTAFSAHWKQQSGDDVIIYQSHGGSGKQARSIIDGLDADVATLGLAGDIDSISEKAGLLPDNWITLLPHNSAPYTSIIVFLVRKGNPKGIHDWDDLVQPEISVVTPNPKTSGGAKWNYLAAWGYALKKWNGNQEKAKEFVTKLYRNVPVLDSGARGSTITFSERGLGDVCISWENEAFLAKNELGQDEFEIILPSITILAEPSVAVIEKNAKRKGTSEVSHAYLEYLYSDHGQRIAAKNFFRPRNKNILKQFKGFFPDVKHFTIDEAFGDWHKVQNEHFADGKIFDQIYQPETLSGGEQ